jgi:alpha-beta hydrolase superfamily lysophospholipase
MEFFKTKTMKKLLFTFSLFFTFAVFSQNYPIGHTTIMFEDPNRGNRQIETEIYYPATAAGDDTPGAVGSFPVIVFGHGFVMAWSAYENLWEEFVSRGYIMVFPRTEGNILSTDHQEFGWDLQFLVTAMQQEGGDATSLLNGLVAPETALMGHSMGGGAAFLAADSLVTNGNTNLKTLVGLAPAESTSNGVSSIASATQITLPSLILSGEQDGVTPPADHHNPMYDNLASNCKSIIHIIGGAHCYFANSNFNCDFGESTSSTGIAVTREEQHEVTFDFVNLWLDYTLKNDCNDFSLFSDSLNTSTRINFNQECNVSVTTIDTSVTASAFNLEANESGATYQWIDCNDNLPLNGETGITFEPQESGDYAVEITLNGCSSISSCHSFLVASLNKETNEPLFKVYPNPSNGSFMIESASIRTIEITNVQGSIVYSNSISVGKSTINTHLIPGVYFWKASNNQSEIQAGKLIIR